MHSCSCTVRALSCQCRPGSSGPFPRFTLQLPQIIMIHNSYTIVCLSVRGDNPRALASGLSPIQADNHGITILYHLYQCRPCTLWDISCKSDRSGIVYFNLSLDLTMLLQGDWLRNETSLETSSSFSFYLPTVGSGLPFCTYYKSLVTPFIVKKSIMYHIKI